MHALIIALAVTIGIAALVAILMRHPRSTPPVTFTRHARERMALRDVTEKQITQTIARPDDARIDLENGSIKYTRSLGRREVTVCVAQNPHAAEKVVKTVFCTYVFSIPEGTAGLIIGREGRTVRQIQDTYGVRIHVARNSVRVGADTRADADHANDRIQCLVGTHPARRPVPIAA